MAKSMVERLREEKEKMKQKGSKATSGFFKLPKTDDAEVKIRILPARNFYESAPDLFYKRFGTHWINGNRIICPKLTVGDACPICETVSELYDSGSEDDIEAAKEFRVKKRNWVNIVEVNEDNTYGEPKIYEFGPKLLENILGWCVDPEYNDLSDPEGGYAYRVIKTKRDGFPNYDGSKPAKNPTKIAKKQMAELLEKSADIHSMINKQLKTYDEIKATFDLGGGSVVAAGVSEPEETEEVDQDALLKRINKRLEKDEE